MSRNYFTTAVTPADKRTMSARSFPVILSMVLVFGSLSVYVSGGSSIQVRPTCFIRGWPPSTSLLLGYLPSSTVADDKHVYQGHYCYPNKTARWCRKPPFSYKSFNCTSEPLTDGVKVKCNMIGFLKKLYPSFWDSSLSSQLGEKLCMVISASNKTNTSYTKFKCCNIQTSTKFSAIENFKLTTPAKGQINVTWRSPSDIDDSTKVFTEYIFHITMVDSDINKTIVVSPSKPQSPVFFHVISNLQPYTRYRLTGAAYVLIPDSGIQSKPVEVRTLPEAPGAPPIIIETRVISQKELTRTVAVKWMHPVKQKRNGVIIKTVVEYQRQTDSINETFPYYVKQIVNGSWTNTTITGLTIDYDYVLTLQSCTSPVDCSKRSEQITLKGIGPRDQPSTGDNLLMSSTTLILTVVCAVLVGCGLVILVLYCLKRNEGRDPGAESPSLEQLPEDITILQEEQTDMEERGPAGAGNIYSEIQQYSPETATHDQAPILQVDDSSDKPSGSNRQSQEEIPLC